MTIAKKLLEELATYDNSGYKKMDFVEVKILVTAESATYDCDAESTIYVFSDSSKLIDENSDYNLKVLEES